MNSNGFQVSYFVHDHLGNTRIVYHTVLECDQSEVNYILEHAIDYYPYGKVLREHTNCEDARYLTTHHERDKETGLDYRGARFYDPDIGRFLSLDPLAMEFPQWSDYNYVLGNPIALIDADGRAPEAADPPYWTDNGDGTFTAEKGAGAWNLSRKLGISPKEAMALLKNQGYEIYKDKNDGHRKVLINPGDIVTIDEAMDIESKESLNPDLKDDEKYYEGEYPDLAEWAEKNNENDWAGVQFGAKAVGLGATWQTIGTGLQRFGVGWPIINPWVLGTTAVGMSWIKQATVQHKWRNSLTEAEKAAMDKNRESGEKMLEEYYHDPEGRN